MVTAPLAFWLPPWQLQDWQRTSAMQFRLPGNLGPRAHWATIRSLCALRQRQLATFKVRAQRVSGKRRTLFASDSERPLISEQSGRSAGVYEHDILVLPAAIADE